MNRSAYSPEGTAAQPLALAGDNSTAAYDVERIRADFPALHQEVYGKPLVYLDNAASALKPQAVIDAMVEISSTYYSNVHRGVHRLSQLSTEAFERARTTAARFLNAGSPDEIVFTRGATEAINLVAESWGRTNLRAGDEILITELEHHANIVPWQMIAERTGARIRVAPVDELGELDAEAFGALLGPRTKMVAITHISNAFGTIVPLAQLIPMAKSVGATVLIDGCQAAPHMGIDVQALGCDFYTFSAHKVYGPTGIGVLYGKADVLEAMPPYQGGGEMIASVTFERSTFKEPPHRFEAGTPAIIESVALGAAIDYLEAIGFEAVSAHERGLLAYATERLQEIPGVRFYGQARDKAAILSFDLDVAHPHDIGTILDRAGVAVRAGHHCAQPLMNRFDVAATARASFGLYNTKAEVDILVEAVGTVREFFG